MQTLFLLEAVPIIPVYISKQNLSRKKKDAATVFFLDTFCVVSVNATMFPYICTPIAFYMGHMSFFDLFFNGNRFYPQTTDPQTTTVISSWFVGRYFDQVGPMYSDASP